MNDSKRTLGVVVAIGLALVAGIVLVVRYGHSRLLDEEELAAAVAASKTEIAEATGSEKASKIKRLSESLAQRAEKAQPLAEGTRGDLRETYEKLSPAEQAQFIALILPNQFKLGLEKFREEYPTSEARAARVAQMAADMRREFEQQSPEDLWKRKQDLETPQGKAYLQTVQGVYRAQLSSAERSDFEPVMREFLRQVEVLVQVQRPK